MNPKNKFYKPLKLNDDTDITEDIINEEEIFLADVEPIDEKNLSKHVKVINLSNFSIKFSLDYIIDNKNLSLNSGECLPLYARQIPIPKGALNLKLNIFFIAYPDISHKIYTKDLRVNRTYEFTVTGTIDNSVVTEN